jgi:endo-1,4-beta-xylanase
MKMKFYMLLALILVTISLAFMLWTMPSGLLASMPATSDTLVPQSTYPPRSVEATTTPEPSRPYELYLPLVLKKAWTVKLMVYPGPSNVDYGPGVELPQGTELTPLGRYVDFVKVQWTDEGGTLQEGFVWVAVLGNLPENLPELSKDEITWVETSVIESNPLRVETPGMHKIFGTGIKIKNDIEIWHSYEVDEATPESSSGVGFGNDLWDQGDNFRVVGLTFQWGEWHLYYQVGSQFPIWETVSGLLPRQTGQVVLQVDGEGETVTVFKVSEIGKQPIITRGLQSPLYAPTRRMVVTAQAGPAPLLINDLEIEEAPTGEYEPNPETELAPLAEWAKELGVDLWLGSSIGRFPRNFIEQQEIIGTVFNRNVFQGGSLMWEFVHPEPDRYEFWGGDNVANYASMIHIHPLIVGDPPAPAWLVEGQYSREELIDIMSDHIRTVMGHYRTHYPNKPRVVNVVNEPIMGGSSWASYEDGIWLHVIGPEYVELALRAAKEADPDAVLMINESFAYDYDTGTNTRFSENQEMQFFYNFIDQLKQRGTPIDAIGIELHLSAAHPPSKEELIETLTIFAQLGVDIYATELDVDVSELSGTREAKLARQAEVFRDAVLACIESNVCSRIDIGGLTDNPGDAWIERGYKQAEAPTLFDEDYQPKPAYFAIRDALRAAASQP